MSRSQKIESGLAGLDSALQNIRLGDSVVWQINTIEDYLYFVRPFAEKSISLNHKTVYFRFAEHKPLLAEQTGLTIFELDPDLGFEAFTVKVNRIIEEEGPDTRYIFDCVSELQSVWAADFMMRNFFMAICPVLKELRSVAYFSLLRHMHSYTATGQVREAATLYLNTIKGNAGMYVHPLKVANRMSSTMFLPHLFKGPDGEELIPLTDGISTSKYYALLGPKGISSSKRRLDNWEIFFMKAQSAVRHGPAKQSEIKDKLYRILIGRDPERAKLFKENFSIQDYININDRLVGSGSIGGKSAGMLLARKIIENNRPDLAEYLEPHDSFYIGSNVFYTYLISNNWWKLWFQHKSTEGYYIAAKALKSQLGYGKFPEMVRDMFKIMLDHFGQNPIIVRSSSFLEDGFGNAFAGKYDSVFLVNEGTLEDRYEAFVRAVKEVYASAMDESALVYRQQRGLDKSDEQMSILVQRVSGSIYQDIYLPGAAGVAYSTNTYAWNKEIDPKAGLVRIVAGLGTRAVDRISNDYPRIASLDKPNLGGNANAQFAQRNVDVLDFQDNSLVTVPLEEVIQKSPLWYQKLIVEHDRAAEEKFSERGIKKEIIYTTCDTILRNEQLVTVMREMLATIQEHYRYPVDVEFTMNFSEDGDFLIDLVQCRPLQAKGTGAHSVTLPDTPPEKTFFRLYGGAMGGPINMPIDLVAIVDGKGYYELPYSSKFSVPSAIDAINHYAKLAGKNLMLLGPGRWGTSSAELGVPIRFSQICNAKALCEMSFESGHLMPELSFGSHFFQDLVETDIFYGAIYEKDCSEGKQSLFYPELLESLDNLYPVIPGAPESLTSLVRVYDTSRVKMLLLADSTSTETLCMIQEPVKGKEFRYKAE